MYWTLLYNYFCK